MKVIAVILADLERSPPGTRSRLAEPLAGVPVLRRTVQRLAQVKTLGSIHVLARPAERPRVQELLAGLPAIVHPSDLPPAPHEELVRVARKWALDNWRGGIGGACAFDESFHAAALQAVAKAASADAVMAVPAHAVLLSPPLAGAMIEHLRGPGKDYRFVFTQGPPGLTPILMTAPILDELVPAAYPPGVLLAYKPAAAEPDLISKPCCYQVPTAVAMTHGRLLADTSESFATCEAVLKELGEQAAGDAEAVCRFLADRRPLYVPPLPAELEVELTTQDSLPGTRLRPAGKAVPARGEMDLRLLERVVGELAQRDDSLVVFGGFGDPLCHPQWREALRLTRQAGIFGISVQTTGKRLAQIDRDALLNEPPDLLVVRLDAASEAVYAQVQGEPGLDAAVQAVLALDEARRQRRQVRPVVVPSMIKSRLNVGDLEAFFEQWVTKVGSCWIEGYSDRAGQMEPLQVASMAPLVRVRCRRLRSRLVVLADGRTVSCDQDYQAIQTVGDLRRQSLQEVWLGTPLQHLRDYLPAAAQPVVLPLSSPSQSSPAIRSPQPATRPSPPAPRPPTPDTRPPKPDPRNPTPDTRPPTPDTRHPTPDTRPPTPDTRHPTPDPRHPPPALCDRCEEWGRP
jgi:hypothetical protein